MGREAGNLVSKSLCLDYGDVVDDSLVYMEVVRQPARQTHQTRHLAQPASGKQGWTRPPLPAHLLSIVLLDNRSGRPLHGLGSHSSLHTESQLVRKGQFGAPIVPEVQLTIVFSIKYEVY